MILELRNPIRAHSDSVSMVNVCPTEADPRQNVEAFVRDPEVRAMAGLRTGGATEVLDVLTDELRKQHPDMEIVVMDRDMLSDNGIDFPKELAAYFDKKVAGGAKVNFVMPEEPPIMGWQTAAERLKGSGSQVYTISLACRQVPVCTKLL